MREVGPRRAMPSGGLLAMGNLRNIARDVGSGLLDAHLPAAALLERARGARTTRVVAIGDVFALLMGLTVRAPLTYVGTAKSVRVAPYGFFERRALRRADEIFVRDERHRAAAARARCRRTRAGQRDRRSFRPRGRSASRCRRARLHADARAFSPAAGRAHIADARFLLEVVRRVALHRPHLGAVVSIAPMLDAATFARGFREDGWEVDELSDARIPFALRHNDRVIARAWNGSIGPLLARAQVVMGQAGTANEAAAAAGVPVVAFERDRDRKTTWYRMRQHGLLGEALAVLPGDPAKAASDLAALLDDAPRRAMMGAQGRERMGRPGGARAIARAIVERLR